MAKEKQESSRHGGTARESVFDESIFGAPVGDESGYLDIFSSAADLSGGGMQEPPAPRRPRSPSPRGPRRFSDTQKVLLLAIVAVAALLSYGLLSRIRQSMGAPEEVEEPTQEPQEEASTEMPPLAELPEPQEEPVLPPARNTRTVRPTPRDVPSPDAISLELAERFYHRRDFDQANGMYRTLHQQLPATESNRALRDFLLLRMALCNKNTGNVAEADTLFRRVSLSRMPILRALARYHQSLMLMDRQRYLEAATRAHQTAALIEVIDYDARWTSAVKRECSLLVSEAMTRHLLMLSDADGDLPPGLWTPHADVDCFANLDEAQLRVFLASGAERLDEALLSPQIREVTTDEVTRRWAVICNGAPVEELLARLATQADLNIRWRDEDQPSLAEDTIRRRPVYLYLTSATARQAIATAAGSVGLLARFNAQGDVQVLDPSSYTSLAAHTKMLAEECVSLWQRFLLASQEDDRVPNGHFALGLVQHVREHADEAVAEYKLIANRFPQHELAPYALLYAGRTKVKLRDYTGAHEDLKQLVELYPDSPLSDRACLDLAEISYKAGLYAEASGLYRKVFNMGLSTESQTEAALGAGRCYFENGDFDDATKWLNRYLSLAQDQDRREFHSACLLLGKAYLALHKPRQAQAALNLALQGELSRQQHVETIAILVRSYIEQELLFEALQTLEGTTGWQLSQQEMIELLVLRARVLRLIGLGERAISLLAEKGPFLPNPQLKGKVALELARCYAQSGDWERARKTLSDVFGLSEPGPMAHEIGCELARVLLKLQQPGQAIPICSQLLDHATGDDRKEVLRLLARAHRAEQEYDRAVAVLLEQYKPAVSDSEPAPADESAVK